MSAETGSSGIHQEQISFNNVQVQIVLAQHAVTTEREFAANRKAIEGVGEKFFKRGFTNIYLQEEGGGAFASVIPKMNAIAREHRSYRTAFWQVVRQNTVENAKDLTQIFEENPVERYIRSRRKDGKSDEAIHIEAFFYASLTALDSLGRKGFQIEMAAEQPTEGRAMMLQSAGNLIDECRRKALLAKEFDQKFADQLRGIIQKHPTRSRIMTVYGNAHRLFDYLPEDLKSISRTLELFPNIPKSDFSSLMHDIQDGTLTDQEIMDRINSNPQEFLS